MGCAARRHGDRSGCSHGLSPRSYSTDREINQMKRRRFLLTGLGAASGALITARYAPAQVSTPRRKVLIIGGGLAGLVAGYELDKKGFDVSLFEAQSRPGGRVLTYRQFDEGLYSDAGAARIPRDHDLT